MWSLRAGFEYCIWRRSALEFGYLLWLSFSLLCLYASVGETVMFLFISSVLYSNKGKCIFVYHGEADAPEFGNPLRFPYICCTTLWLLAATDLSFPCISCMNQLNYSPFLPSLHVRYILTYRIAGFHQDSKGIPYSNATSRLWKMESLLRSPEGTFYLFFYMEQYEVHWSIPFHSHLLYTNEGNSSLCTDRLNTESTTLVWIPWIDVQVTQGFLDKVLCLSLLCSNFHLLPLLKLLSNVKGTFLSVVYVFLLSMRVANH